MNYPNNIGDILNKLTNVKQIKDNEWQADCPCGGHSTPQKHLTIGNDGNKALVTCFGGTHTYEDICKVLGFDSLTYSKDNLTAKEQPKVIKDIYKYIKNGQVIFETVRFIPKDFRQRRPDGKNGYIWDLKGIELCLYHHDDIKNAVKNGDTIYICEGEKDVDRLCDMGFIATCNPMGAGKWLPQYTDTLNGANQVIIIPDKDDAGRKHAKLILQSITGKIKNIKIIEVTGDTNKDVSDWFDNGGILENFNKLIEQTPIYKPIIRIARERGNSLMNRHFDPIKWIVPNMLPQGMALLAGTPKTGKSRMALNIALAVATGGLALDKMNVKQGSVLYLSLEDNDRRLNEHLKDIYIDKIPDLDKIEFWYETKLLNEGGLEDIEYWLKNNPDARLVVIDTLQKVRPKTDTKGGIYAQDYDAVSPLTNLAAQYNIAILTIHHLNKRPTADDPMELISGSTGLTGAVDTTIIVKRKRGENEAIMHIYGRDMEDADIALDFTGGSWVWVGNEKQVRMSEDRQAIIDLLKNSPDLTPDQIARALGKNKSTTRGLLMKMMQADQISYCDGVYNAITET